MTATYTKVMRLNTWDLHDFSVCPKRYWEDKPIREVDSPAREIMQRIVLLRALGRENKWTVKGIASIFDYVFWKGREYTPQNKQACLRGVYKLRKLYDSLPRNFDGHSCQNLKVMMDRGVELSSSGDFILETGKEFEIWIYANVSPSQMRRSVLPAAERFLLENSMRAGATDKKPIHIVFYYTPPKGIRPRRFSIKCPQNNTGIRALVDLIGKGVSFPSESFYCEKCNVKC